MYKFEITVYIRHRNRQVKFEFGYGSIILDRVIPLKEIFSVHSPTFVCTCIRLNIAHVDMQVKFEFGLGTMIFHRVIFSVYDLQLLFGCMYKV
jgi:hypothetical protein